MNKAIQSTHGRPTSGRDRATNRVLIRSEDAQKPAGAGNEQPCTTMNPNYDERR